MRKLIFIISLTLFLLSCGGGGGDSILPPADRDLSGLEGIWDYTIIGQGTITGPGGFSVPIAVGGSGFLTITQNTVTDDEGREHTWSYNGTTLTIAFVVNSVDWDSYCGNAYMSEMYRLTVPISPGATFGNISGTDKVTLTSENCPVVTGTLQIEGNVSRR